MRMNVRVMGAVLTLGLLAFLAPEHAMAAAIDSLGTAADNIIPSGKSIVDLLTGFMYLAGVSFGVKSALQLRDHTESPQQVRLAKPLTSTGVSAIFLGLPSFLDRLLSSFGPSFSLTSLATSWMPSWGPTGTTPQGTQGGMGQVAQAFATSIPSLNHLITVAAAVAGLFLIMRAIFMLPQLEQGRVEPGKIWWLLLSGMVLWALLPFISTVMQTQGMPSLNTNILSKAYSNGGTSFDQTIDSVLTFVTMIGLIAFIRGTLILKALGENKDGAMGRALTHIFAGAAAMNIQWTVAVLATTIGAHGSICGIASAGVLCSF